MGRNHITILFILFASQVFAQCDVLGGLLELQFTTNYDALLRGDGQCLKPTTVTGGLVLSGGELKIIEGDTTGQVLTWDGGTWVPQLVIRDTFFNGLSRSGRNVKLGGTLVQNTTIDGVKTYDFVLSNMRRINFEAERTGGAAYTTMQLGSTDIEGFDLYHISTSSPTDFGYLRVNNTTGNILRLQSATNVQTEVNQYWDGASHVTDIGSTDGVDGKTLRITKTGMFAFSLDKVDEFSSPGIMMYDTFTNEIRYQSPDILLGSTVAEPANQVVYGTGTGIDSDTTLKYINRGLLFKDTAGTTTPKVWAWYKDATNTFRMFEMFPRNQTNYPYNTKFGMYGSNYPNANHSGASPGNHVFAIGFNIGREETSLSSLRNQFETHYWGELLNGVRSRNYEWMVEQTDTLNRIHRPIQIQAAHNGSAGDVGFESDGFYLSEYESRTQYLKYNRYDQQWYFNDTISLLFNKPQKNTPLLSFRSNDNSRLWPMFQSDASDNLVINRDGNNLYTYASRFVFNTLGEISTADGNAIKVGASARPGKLLVTGNTSDLFILDRSGEQWGTYVNTDNIAYTRHNGNPYFQAYETDGAKIVIGNNNVGIGDASGLNLQSRFSLLQKSNTAEGGMALINTSSAQSYLQTNASGSFSLCVGSSTERFVVTNSGAAGIGTSSPAQKLHVEGTARITGSDGTATTITGRDADGDISNVSLDGLQIVGGTLSQAYDNNEYGNGTHTWNPSYIHVYANADVGNVTLNLSSPFSEGRDYFVAAVNNGTNTVTLSGALYVDGVGSVSTYTLGAWEQVTIRYRDAWSAYFIDK